jgi:uncharacterized protein
MPGLERDPAPPGPVVRGFADGGFSIGGEIYPAVLLTPAKASEWRPPPLADLAVAQLEPLLSLDPPPEFVLLGTGAATRFPPRALREGLEARGIGLEAMDSRAAARAWGLLRGEERWIAAALMPL